MDTKLLRPISCATTLIFFVAQAAYPQTTAPMPPASQPQAAPVVATEPPPAADQQETPVFKKEQIDQLLAPIALYPDDLIAMVLMASTYPTEIVMADRWVRKPENAKLKGDQLAAALDKQTWDPSVKSLVPFPQVLQMMSEQLDWTQKLGDAMLAQQQDVMEAVQRLRKSAESAGTLQSSPQQTVTNQGDTIIIQPSDPQTVYVPAYNPQTAYGTWPYPSYPPPYYPPPPAYYPAYPYGGALATGLFFGAGLAITAGLWGWGNCNWNGGGSINIDNSRYNNINRSNINAGRAQQLQAGNGNWRHDPGHRGGTPYRDRGSQQKFQRASTRPAGAGQNFRGFGDNGRNGIGNNRGGIGDNRGGIGNNRGGIGDNRGGVGNRNGVGSSGRTNIGSGGANRPGSGGAGVNRPSQRPAASANRPSAGARPAQRPSSPAFSGMSNGAGARAQSARGSASRSSMGAARSGGGAAAARAGGGAARGGAGGARGGGRR